MSGANGHEADAEGEQGPAPTWRHLSFYEPSKVRDTVDFASSPSAFRSPNEIAVVSHASIWPSFVQQQFSNGQSNGSTSALPALNRQECVLIGDISGRVRVLDAERYSEVGAWQAFYGSEGTALGTGRVTHLSCDDKGRVVTLGEDDGAKFPVIRIWDLNTTAKASSGSKLSPRLLGEGKVQHGSRPHPIAALAHTPSLSFLSIGLADGSVLLLRGLDDVLKSAPITAESISSVTPAITLPKFKVAYQPAASKVESASTIHEAVTGLGFAEQSSKLTETGKGSEAKAVAGSKGRNGIDRSRKSLANTGLIDAERNRNEKRGPPETVNLFIVTLTRILRYTVLGKGAGSPASVVDDVGCALGCARLVPLGKSTAALNPLEGRMVIARDEAIYIVGSEGREMSLAYEGPKASICLAATQLVIVSPPITATSASDSATVRQYVNDRSRLGRTAGRSESSPRIPTAPTEVAKVTIFDLDNKLVAYSGTFEGGVKEAWCGSQGDVCVLNHDGTLTRLEEKTLRQKLDVVFRKSLYLLAVNVAKSHASRSISTLHEVDDVEPLLADIYRKYGDALYEKGDFEGAMNQFVKTIGFTQPSYVIRKFLDAQRITNLTTYLQELHARGVANSDHTTLLLNCYTKLKDVASLDKFIKRPLDIPSSGKEANGQQVFDEDLDGVEEELPFDLDTAVWVCRQAGYFEHAAYLAKRYAQHDEYIRIQIEDRKDFANALSHIHGLSAEEAERNLLRYGKAMLQQIPAETTSLLIELCSGAFQPTPMAVGAGVEASKRQNKSAAATYLTSLQFGPFGKAALPAVEVERSATPSVAAEDHQEVEEKVEPASTYTIPSPRIFFAHFIKHPTEFETFLETVALARWGQSVGNEQEGVHIEVAEVDSDGFGVNGYLISSEKEEQISVWNTLLELYLTSARASNQSAGYAAPLNGAQRSAQKAKALQLLRQHKNLPYDTSQALTVCSQEDFVPGVVYLYERVGMYEDILYLYMEQDELQRETNQQQDNEPALSVMDCLNRYGDHEPQLYPILLRYLASSEKLLSRHHGDLETILQHIEDERLMSPLEVVQTLSKKGIASVGLIRSFLIRSINYQKADMETNSKLTNTYRHETNQKLIEIESLKDLQQPKIFQQTKCNACSGTLDLPIVHFMCKHSFHARCLGEEETECPICAKSHGVILEIRKNNLTFGDRQDL
jgi:hypothetical protein